MTHTHTHIHIYKHTLDTAFIGLGESVIPSGHVFSSGRGSMLIGLEGQTTHANTHTHNPIHLFACTYEPTIYK